MRIRCILTDSNEYKQYNCFENPMYTLKISKNYRYWYYDLYDLIGFYADKNVSVVLETEHSDLDSAEYSGSLIILLNDGMSFVKRNMKNLWEKTPDYRIEMPDYCERSIFEALVNALIHRDYLINGSEVHLYMFDDRLGYMERQCSGLSKIRTAYENAANYQPGLELTFRSNRVEFTVKLPNLNFKASTN